MARPRETCGLLGRGGRASAAAYAGAFRESLTIGNRLRRLALRFALPALGAAAFLAAVLVVIATRQLASSLPRPTGPYPVGVTTITLPRSAPDIEPGTYDVQVWYPGEPSSDRAPYGTGTPGLKRFVYHHLVRSYAARDVAVAAAGAPLPVVVYVAGWGGQRTDNTVLAENLASHGFVVAALSDPAFDKPADPGLSAAPDFSSENAYDATLRLASRRIAFEAERASDVLDELKALDEHDPSGRFTDRLALREVGVMGFSFGGAVALEACNRDHRFVAALNLDGWLFGVGNERARPYFVMDDNAPFPGPKEVTSSDPETRYQALLTVADDPFQREALSHDGYQLSLANANHLDFTDVPAYSALLRYRRSESDARRTMNVVNAYALNFFDRYLAGRPAPLLVPGTALDPSANLVRTSASRARVPAS